MTQEQYQILISTYGVHPARWPEDLRLSALSFTQSHAKIASKINADEAVLDEQLGAIRLPETDNDLLTARILKTARATPQHAFLHIETPANDHPTRFLPDDSPMPPRLNWKYIAATLLITMGIGFGVGQSLTDRSDYQTAENLLNFNNETEAAPALWLEPS